MYVYVTMLMILPFIQLEKITTNRNILNKFFLSLQKWFYDNYMVLNPGKCCYMSFGSNPDRSDLILEDSTKLPSAEDRQ